MIKITELKRACNEVISQTFPNIKVYGNDTVDGYTRPAFFTEIIPHGYSHESKSFAFMITMRARWEREQTKQERVLNAFCSDTTENMGPKELS